MATQIFTLDPEAPTDIIDALALETGSTYLIQAITSTPVSLFEAADAPSVTESESHIIRPPETWAIKVGSDPIWIWGDGKVAVSSQQ